MKAIRETNKAWQMLRLYRSLVALIDVHYDMSTTG